MKNIMIDMAFSVETDNEFEKLTQIEILAALFGRIQSLIQCWEPEAFGFCDEYEIPSKGDLNAIPN